MIIPPQTIRKMGIVTPCADAYNRGGRSGGLGPAGYDLALDVVDLNPSSPHPFMEDRLQDDWVLPPGGFALASVHEYISLPPDVIGLIKDKSSWARLGLAVQNTVAEPGWRGYLTLELSNHGPKPIHLSWRVPICQVIFFRMEAPTELPYSGKYQDQDARPVRAID